MLVILRRFVDYYFDKIFKSNERNEDFFIGLGDFLMFFIRRKSANALITTDVHSCMLIHL